MFVAKLPGSTYAMQATKAGPSRCSAARTRPRERRSSRSLSAWGWVWAATPASTSVQLHPHRPRQRSAEHVHVVGEAHEQRAVERLLLDDLEPRTGGDPALGQVAQHLGVGVRDAHEDPARAG